MTVKQQIRELVERLPDDVDWERVQYELYVLSKIEAGLEDVRQGRMVPHDEVKRRFGLA